MKTLRALTLAILAAAWLGSASAQGLRPEVGKPLQQAGELLRAGKARDALAKVAEAERVSNLTAAEQLTVDRMKAAAAQRAGDNATAVRALESIASKVGGRELGQIAEQLAAAYAQLRNNGKAEEWMNKAIQAGNNSPTINQLQDYLRSVSGDYNAIAKDAAASVAAAESAGRRPGEGDLLRLADAQQRLGQSGAYVNTLEKLVLNYPKKDYWSAFLARVTRKPGFAPRFALDVLRLKLAAGILTETGDYMEMAQLALQDRLPTEAMAIIDQGYKSGALGTGAEAARHQRLRDLALKRQAEAQAALDSRAADAAAQPRGDDLVDVGYAFVTEGRVDEGIALIQKGIAKGNLKHPEDAKLRLGMAQLKSPKLRSAAVKTLRSVKGKDGVEDIAGLWLAVGSP